MIELAPSRNKYGNGSRRRHVRPFTYPVGARHGLKLSDIRIRDPFVLADAATKTYYLYAQSGPHTARLDGARRNARRFTYA